MTRHASCYVALCTNNFRNFPGLAFYRIPKERPFQREYQQNMYVFLGTLIWSCFFRFLSWKVKSPQVHLLLSALSVLTPLKHSTSLSAMFVYIRVPLNNLINARSPGFGPMLSLFSELSYWEKLCPRSWVLRPRAQFLPIQTDLGQWITFLFIFSYWDLKVLGKFCFSLQPRCSVEVGSVRVDGQARNRLRKPKQNIATVTWFLARLLIVLN